MPAACANGWRAPSMRRAIPAWTADGIVSDHWAPVSPVTGALDAFRWRAPVEVGERAVRRVARRQGRSAGWVGCRRGACIAHDRARAQPPHPAPPATVEPRASSDHCRAPAQVLPSAAPAISPARLPTAARPFAVSRGARRAQAQRRRPPKSAQRRYGPIRERTAPAAARVQRRVETSRRRAAAARASPAEPKIFVPPRAPDDPGTEAGDDDCSRPSDLGRESLSMAS